MRAPTLDEWNSDAFTRLSLTSESLTWDPTMTHYSDQEAAMTDYSGNIVHCAAVRGHVGNLAINLLSSLSSDLVDVTDDENFHQVLTSKVMISSVETSLNGCWGLYSYGMSMDRPYLKLELEAKRSLSRETISPLDFHS
jgi:hypothetical protein